MLSILMLLLFCYPILTIVNRVSFVLHIPLLYLYIGFIWIISLVLLIIAAEAKPFQKIKQPKDE